MAVEKWLTALRDKLAELEGLDGGVHYYKDMPGSLSAFPCAVISLKTGAVSYSTGSIGRQHHNVIITIYTAGSFLPSALRDAVPFIERVRDKIAENIKLNNTVVAILPASSGAVFEGWYEGPGGIDYGEKMLTGINFFYVVKEDVTGEFTPAQ